jgi:hypothetical protein
MQFNSKTESKSTVASKVNNLTKGNDVTNMVTFKKMKAPALEKDAKGSLFSGGKSEGNSISTANSDKKPKVENLKIISKNEMLIEFNSKDIFVTSKAKNSIRSFIVAAKKVDKNAKIEISFANSTSIGSSTVAKQISLGRAVNIKNLLKKDNYNLSDISLKLSNFKDEKYKHGYVRLRVIH